MEESLYYSMVRPISKRKRSKSKRILWPYFRFAMFLIMRLPIVMGQVVKLLQVGSISKAKGKKENPK